MLLLFFGPLAALLFVLVPRGDGLAPAAVTYLLLLLGLSAFAAVALVRPAGGRIALTLALAAGMFLVHIVVGVGGCTLILATQ